MGGNNFTKPWTGDSNLLLHKFIVFFMLLNLCTLYCLTKVNGKKMVNEVSSEISCKQWRKQKIFLK